MGLEYLAREAQQQAAQQDVGQPRDEEHGPAEHHAADYMTPALVWQPVRVHPSAFSQGVT